MCYLTLYLNNTLSTFILTLRIKSESEKHWNGKNVLKEDKPKKSELNFCPAKSSLDRMKMMF